jgi:FkbM family methyltransferase
LDPFFVVAGEGVSREVESYGLFEPELTEAFLRLIQADQCVVDIGMHLGYYTTLFARLAGPRGTVHAFEPTPSTRDFARRNVGRFPNVTVHPQAVWWEEGTLTFHDYGLAWMAFNSFAEARLEVSAKPREFEVATTTLDAFRASVGRAVALVKVDAESAEAQILQGASKLIELDQPLITLEVGDREGAPASRSLVDLMQARGYGAWEFRGGRFSPHQRRDRYDYDNLIFAPRAMNLADR